MAGKFRRVLKYVVTLVLPLAGLSVLLGSCASTPCNTDSCYDRKISSVDPYEDGDVAAWGTEKEEKAKEEAKEEAKEQPRIPREFKR